MSVTTTVESIVSKLYAGTLQPVGVTKTATYKSRTTGTYNPASGARTATDTSVTINVIPKGIKSYMEDGIEKKTAIFLAKPVSGVSFTDSVNDTLTVDSLEYRVVGIKPISLGATDLMYEIKTGMISVGGA